MFWSIRHSHLYAPLFLKGLIQGLGVLDQCEDTAGFSWLLNGAPAGTWAFRAAF